MQNACDVVEDPLSGFLKMESVRCKCTKKKNKFGKYMISLFKSKVSSMIKTKSS
jgi:hypothetical protein